MIITAAGEGCFKIQTGGVTVLIEGVGGEKSRMKPDIFLRASAQDAPLPDAGFIIKGPGEYELRGIEIRGFPPFTYLIKAEDMNLCLLSSADQKILDRLTMVDVAFVAIANHDTSVLIRQLVPRFVIATAEACQTLAKELGARPDAMDKFTIKKRDVPADGMKLICLTA